MKISKKVEKATKEDKVWWSFEYFPPRTAQVRPFGMLLHTAEHLSVCEQGLQNLLDRIERMRALGPEFIDITWYALEGCLTCHFLIDVAQECRWTHIRAHG